MKKHYYKFYLIFLLTISSFLLVENSFNTSLLLMIINLGYVGFLTIKYKIKLKDVI